MQKWRVLIGTSSDSEELLDLARGALPPSVARLSRGGWRML